MTETRKVKVESIIDSQIPNFINAESPLFKEFLKQYYISQTHFTGVLDIANNLTEFKNIDTYSSERFYTLNENNKCYLVEPVLSYEDVIQVNSTVGFPDKYGLIQIEDEIITYTGVTETSFTGCIRGFSGVSDINDSPDESSLVFSFSDAGDHNSKVEVKNLSLLYYTKLFEKFKAQYLPDFERRTLESKVDLNLLLSRVRDFYLTKGTDISFKILFGILFNDKVSVFKPKEYLIKSSPEPNLVTKNILVELVDGSFNPSEIIGLTLHQTLNGGLDASASIYNIEYRPTDELDLYEISLDSDSFIYNFTPTKRTSIIEVLTDSILVDSTVGFTESGTVKVKIKNEFGIGYSYTTLKYEGKTINQFLNISGISSTSYSNIKENDEIVEDKLLSIFLDDSTVSFRLLNVIESFNFQDTNSCKINDIISLSSFGDDYSNFPEYNSWIYNYSIYHNVKEVLDSSSSLANFIFYDSIKFRENEVIEVINSNGDSINKIIGTNKIIGPSEIILDKTGINLSDKDLRIKRKIQKSPLNEKFPVYIQNSYQNIENKNLVIASSGLPLYSGLNNLNQYEFTLFGTGEIFTTKSLINGSDVNHKLLSGNKIYLEANSNIMIWNSATSSYSSKLKSGYYFVKRITENSISLFLSSVDLYLSYSQLDSSLYAKPIKISDNIEIGKAHISNYKNVEVDPETRNDVITDKTYDSQLLLKEFSVYKSLRQNKASSSLQIYTIEDAYNAFKS